MKYKLIVQMDLSIVDEYSDIIKHKRKKPIGEPTTIIGTKEEILNKITENITKTMNLANKIYNEGEENVILKKENYG